MKNSLNLTTDEISHVYAALETFAESKNANVNGKSIKEPLKTQLVNSCLKKLDNLSILTYFNGQELTVMLLALHYIMDCVESTGICDFEISDVVSAIEKISDVVDKG